tara:strand:+ start:58 stop:1113 length:1056 start_codon:yes stop_codon:yes gene_type:complete
MNTDLTTLKKPKVEKKDTSLQKWTSAQEELLAEWSEKATCFRWLHSRSEKAYRRRNYAFTIPVIIFSTLTGTANFAMDSFIPEEYKQIAMASVGGVNIFAGILSTLQNFLRYAELMESHRLCEVQWSKFGRNIAVELALDPKRRKPADDFLKVCRAEYDRLIEQSPPIDDPIIKQFKHTFKNVNIRKPDICNGLHPCKIFEITEEEKKAEAVAEASIKLLDKRKPKKWNIPDDKKEFVGIETVKEDNNESIRELESLLNIGRVSSFKNNNIVKEEKNINIMDKINEDTIDKDTIDKDTINEDIVDEDKDDEDIIDIDKIVDTDDKDIIKDNSELDIEKGSLNIEMDDINKQ